MFLLNFDEFLSEFHEELQNITDILDIFTKLPEKFGKILEISGFCDEFHSSVSLFSIDSLVSIGPDDPGRGGRSIPHTPYPILSLSLSLSLSSSPKWKLKQNETSPAPACCKKRENKFD